MATYQLKHRFRELVIVPYIAIGGCWFFIDDNSQKKVITADNHLCKVVECEYKHIFEIEEMIQEHYKMDIISYLKKWYEMDKNMHSLEMVILKLEKE